MSKKKCGNCHEPPPRYIRTLTVEKQGTTVEDDGQPDTDDSNWISQGTIKANFKTDGGSETHSNKQTQAHTVTTITTPKTTLSMSLTTDPSQRLRWGTRIFNIEAAWRNDETGREVTIKAIERRHG